MTKANGPQSRVIHIGHKTEDAALLAVDLTELQSRVIQISHKSWRYFIDTLREQPRTFA